MKAHRFLKRWPPDHAADPHTPLLTISPTKANGTGMGLCICRRIVEAHGGRLVAIRNQGAGVTFQFTLPVEEGAVVKAVG